MRRLAAQFSSALFVLLGLAGVGTVYYFGPFQNRLSGIERRTVREFLLQAEVLRFEELTKPEYVRQDICVRKILGTAYVSRQTKHDMRTVSELETYLQQLERERTYKDQLDQEGVEMSKLKDSDAYMHDLIQEMNDDRRGRSEAAGRASDLWLKLWNEVR